jgi:hypothetical protein
MTWRLPRVTTTLLLLLFATIWTGCSQAHSTTSASTDTSPWYGSRVGADSLANSPIGSSQHSVLAYRFRATWNGTIPRVRFFVVTNPEGREGYSDGTLGTLRVSLVADATGKGHLPGPNVLASMDYKPDPKVLFPVVTFPTAPTVEKGRYYDIVFTNVDPDPAANWVSINSLIETKAGAAAPPLSVSTAVLLGDGADMAKPGEWRTRSESSTQVYTPIVDIFGGKGQHLGVGYMESWVTNPKPIGEAHEVRELFTFSRKKTERMIQARVRVRRTDSDDAPLEIRLETASGKLLAGASVAPTDVPSSTPGWVEARFAKPPTLKPGEQYALVLRSDDVEYETYPLRDGTAFGFSSSTVFPSGYAEYDAGEGWGGWDMWGESNRRDGDLQFALLLSSR